MNLNKECYYMNYFFL